jgi:hypothetical protein
MQKGKMISYRFLFDATNSFRLGFYMMQRGTGKARRMKRSQIFAIAGKFLIQNEF